MKVLNEEKLNRMADFIKDYTHDHDGDVPKFAEILDYMGMSKSVGYRYLTRLKERGIVEYNGKGTLSMEGMYTAKSYSRRVPILGNIICGSPEEEEEYAEGYLAIPEEWIEGECFLLRAFGDSMVDIGVHAGDLVLVRKAKFAEDGQVVVVLTEDGNTLKRFKKGPNGKAWLLAENKSYPKDKRELHPQTIEIQGVALKIIKDIR